MGKKKGKKGKKQPTEAELAAAALAAEEAAKAKAAEEAEAVAYKERVERLKESIKAKEEDLARRCACALTLPPYSPERCARWPLLKSSRASKRGL